MILRNAALFVLAIAGLLLGRVAEPIVVQNRKVRNWPAVDATVTVRVAATPAASTGPSTDVPPRGGQSADPDLRVHYRHEVNGAIYRTTPVTPRADEWLPAGREPTAAGEASYPRRGHFDPERPDRLFFPKPFGFRDYWQVFLWGPLLALGFGGLVLRKPGRRRRGAGASPDREKGWHPLPPRYPLRLRASAAWGVAIVCNVILGAAAYDYFTGEPRARSTASDALVWLALVPGVATAGLAVHHTRRARRVGEPHVSIDTARPRPGARVAVKVELPVRANADLQQVVVGLACVRSQLNGPGAWFAKQVIWEERVERSVGRRAQADGQVSFEQRFTIPPDAAASSAGGFRGPWVEWEVRVEFPLDDGPHYRGKFPLTVDAVQP